MKSFDTTWRSLLLPKYSTNHATSRPSGITTNGVADPGADDDRYGILNEACFNRSLCLERRRTERTGDPFVLAVLYVMPVWRSVPADQRAALCQAICARTRDTDTFGWYNHPAAIGGIFTALGGCDRPIIEASITRKLNEGLRDILGSVGARKVNVSFHFYPESYDGNKPSFKSDEKLYPDLFKAEKSKTAYSIIKRGLDIVGSAGAILLLSPAFMLIPALIKLTSDGPVLFRQRRIGRFGEEFTFLKFRTMYVNNDSQIHQRYIENLISNNASFSSNEQCSAAVYKIVDDPRVTPIGRFLRKTSLDELPQFLNVLRGEMSLVGPRPPIPYEVKYYRYWHRRRLTEVKPGITGLWQVYGRSRTNFDDMVRLDLKYVREQSLWLDLKIILKTPFAIFAGSGAY